MRKAIVTVLSAIALAVGFGAGFVGDMEPAEAHRQYGCNHHNFWSWGGWYKWWWVEYHGHYNNYGTHYHRYSHHDSRGQPIDHWEYKPC